MQRNQRPRGAPTAWGWLWAAGLLILVGFAGWLVLRPSGVPASGPPVGSHTATACNPVASPSAVAATTQARAGSWSISVARASYETSVPDSEGTGTIDAAPGKVFLVLDIRFRSTDQAKEHAIDTALASLACADGTRREADGVGANKGFCFACSSQLATDSRVARQRFVFRIFLAQTNQPFLFRYGNSEPVAVHPGG